jgi:hypothetical protein
MGLPCFTLGPFASRTKNLLSDQLLPFDGKSPHCKRGFSPGFHQCAVPPASTGSGGDLFLATSTRRQQSEVTHPHGLEVWRITPSLKPYYKTHGNMRRGIQKPHPKNAVQVHPSSLALEAGLNATSRKCWDARRDGNLLLRKSHGR